MFHIKFIQSSSSDYQVSNTKSGEFAIGEFRDFFHSSLSYWTQQQYSNQWKEGLRRICRDGLNTSLITDMYDPNSSNIIQWWILRPKENLVYIRNELLFLEKAFW
ncbi:MULTISPECIES: hypothetical protein [Aerosakkonema]|uniref:hypothetical protein n=1 Tax=Aerosakkonema TaxID=1246629 RepID=UPI0035BA151F